jgi:hypothetical protein
MLLTVAAPSPISGATEMMIRGHRNGSVLSATISLMSRMLVAIDSALTLALLVSPFSMIIFGLGQQIMADQGTKEK